MPPKRSAHVRNAGTIDTYEKVVATTLPCLRLLAQDIPGLKPYATKVELIRAYCSWKGIEYPKSRRARSSSSIPPPEPSPEPLSVKRRKAASTRVTRSTQASPTVAGPVQEESISRPLEYPLTRQNPLHTRRPVPLGEDDFNTAARGTPTPPPMLGSPPSPTVGPNFLSPRSTPPPEATNQIHAPPADELSLRQTVEMLAAFRKANDDLEEGVTSLVPKAHSVKTKANELKTDLKAEYARRQRMLHFLLHFVQEQPTHTWEQMFPPGDRLFSIVEDGSGNVEGSEVDAMAKDDIMRYGSQSIKDQLLKLMNEASDAPPSKDKGKGRAIDDLDSEESDVEHELLYPEPEHTNDHNSTSTHASVDHVAQTSNFSPPVTISGAQQMIALYVQKYMNTTAQAKRSSTTPLEPPTRDPRPRPAHLNRPQQPVEAGPSAFPSGPAAIGLPGPSPRPAHLNCTQQLVEAGPSARPSRPSAIGLPGPSPRRATRVMPASTVSAHTNAPSVSHSTNTVLPPPTFGNTAQIRDHDPFVAAPRLDNPNAVDSDLDFSARDDPAPAYRSGSTINPENLDTIFQGPLLSPTNSLKNTDPETREYTYEDFRRYQRGFARDKIIKAQREAFSRRIPVQNREEQNHPPQEDSSQPRPMCPLPIRRQQAQNLNVPVSTARPSRPSIYDPSPARPVVRSDTLPDDAEPESSTVPRPRRALQRSVSVVLS